MGDWQELSQSILIGLIFSFLVAKLISMVISFREDNLRLVRDADLPIELDDSSDSETQAGTRADTLHHLGPPQDDRAIDAEKNNAISEKQKTILAEEDEDDDWEGVESTELDEAFSAASAFVATAASDRLSQKVSNDIQLQLYGLYKIATEGPCSAPQPSALKITARAKWNAWQRLGAMSPEDAMQQYIAVVSELFPTWASGFTSKKEGNADSSASTKGTMGPVFSSFVYEEQSDNELKMDAIHASAREGEISNILKYVESGISVNVRDSEGRSPLHWAVDRGHLNVVELLISKNADVNAQDSEGQTPLHYAVVCEREAIAEHLVKHNANRDIKDNDGNSSCDLCKLTWKWMFSGKLTDVNP